jgi:hypothetical protein
MLVPDTVAVPCAGAELTVTEVAVPLIDSGSVLLLLLAATLALMLATVGADTGGGGGGGVTVMLAVAALEVPPLLVAV